MLNLQENLKQLEGLIFKIIQGNFSGFDGYFDEPQDQQVIESLEDEFARASLDSTTEIMKEVSKIFTSSIKEVSSKDKPKVSTGKTPLMKADDFFTKKYGERGTPKRNLLACKGLATSLYHSINEANDSQEVYFKILETIIAANNIKSTENGIEMPDIDEDFKQELIDDGIYQYTTKSTLNRVAQFCEIFNGIEIPDEPIVIDNAKALLRFSLILEELIEFTEAHDHTVLKACIKHLSEREIALRSKWSKVILDNETKEADLVEILDALIDLRYVSDGAVIYYGLNSQFNPAFDIVHKNNMNKLVNSLEEAIINVQWYLKEFGVKVGYTKIDVNGEDCYRLNCIDDPSGKWHYGKVLKPKGYEKVQLKQLLG